MVVTRHISHDGLLIWPQGANDVWPGSRGKGERAEERKMHKSKRVQRQKRASRGRKHKTQEGSSPLGFSPRDALFSGVWFHVKWELSENWHRSSSSIRLLSPSHPGLQSVFRLSKRSQLSGVESGEHPGQASRQIPTRALWIRREIPHEQTPQEQHLI